MGFGVRPVLTFDLGSGVRPYGICEGFQIIKGINIAAARIMKGSAYNSILLKLTDPSILGQSLSMNPNITPRPSRYSRFQNSPADTYKTDEAKILGNHVDG